ncbi:ubiquitin-like small modifier protein 1 [Streptomyces sp. HUAS MG47]|uniref:ubiquitin-like small modifier protein 1 n=1 Tax=Streptomyces solicamelliae TaxID=3231716 RepID=UPI00387795C4
MAKLFIPTIMRQHVEQRSTLDMPGATLAEVFANLVSSYPGVRSLLHDADGRLRPHINVFLNGDDIRGLDGEKTPVDARDEVHVIPAMAGGSR